MKKNHSLCISIDVKTIHLKLCETLLTDVKITSWPIMNRAGRKRVSLVTLVDQLLECAVSG